MKISVIKETGQNQEELYFSDRKEQENWFEWCRLMTCVQPHLTLSHLALVIEETAFFERCDSF